MSINVALYLIYRRIYYSVRLWLLSIMNLIYEIFSEKLFKDINIIIFNLTLTIYSMVTFDLRGCGYIMDCESTNTSHLPTPRSYFLSTGWLVLLTGANMVTLNQGSCCKCAKPMRSDVTLAVHMQRMLPAKYICKINWYRTTTLYDKALSVYLIHCMYHSVWICDLSGNVRRLW